jgi:hypothetical protein
MTRRPLRNDRVPIPDISRRQVIEPEKDYNHPRYRLSFNGVVSVLLNRDSVGLMHNSKSMPPTQDSQLNSQSMDEATSKVDSHSTTVITN